MEKVILVDEQDNALGLMEKMEAHEKGVLHRAFSVFIFNDKNEMLLQQRAEVKYHSPGLWTNACCSHPREGESVQDAALRRLEEEMGFKCEVKDVFQFIYRADLDKNMIEHELDHVLIGYYQGEIKMDPEEVMDYKYLSLEDLTKDVAENGDNYTVWFKIALPTLLEKFPG